MDQQNNPNKKERRKCNLMYEGKYFLVGSIFGAICFLFWDYFFNHNRGISELQQSIKIEEFKQDSEERLVNYIDGEWISSVGDVIIKINIDKGKDFIIIEVLKDKKTQTKYKIEKINKVNGLFGIVNFSICDISKECTTENRIPIQLNKVFGMDRTITISYDSRLTYCVDADDSCTRAFKRLN
jgi:hypothetical protein